MNGCSDKFPGYAVTWWLFLNFVCGLFTILKAHQVGLHRGSQNTLGLMRDLGQTVRCTTTLCLRATIGAFPMTKDQLRAVSTKTTLRFVARSMLSGWFRPNSLIIPAVVQKRRELVSVIRHLF